MLNIFFLLLGVTICWAGVPERTVHVRPCKLNDYRCIRENLAANSKCRRQVIGSIPKQYTVAEERFEAPGFNASYIDKNLIVRNHDKCYVSDFVINTDRGTARLVIDCPQLDLESDRVLIQHESFYDDAYYYYHIRGIYPMVRMNVVLPSHTHMDLCKAHVYTDVPDLPNFQINPQDKPTKNALSKDLALLHIFERESFFYKGIPLALKFVDSVICDYSCPRRQPIEAALYV